MKGGWPLPAEPYVPGNGQVRPVLPAEIEDSAASGPADQCNPAWRLGLRLLSSGYYWEAHEALEPFWMRLPPNSCERMMAQAMIQAANAGLKWSMGRSSATLRIVAQADALMADLIAARRCQVLGIDVTTMRAALQDLLKTESPDALHDACQGL